MNWENRAQFEGSIGSSYASTIRSPCRDFGPRHAESSTAGPSCEVGPVKELQESCLSLAKLTFSYLDLETGVRVPYVVPNMLRYKSIYIFRLESRDFSKKCSRFIHVTSSTKSDPTRGDESLLSVSRHKMGTSVMRDRIVEHPAVTPSGHWCTAYSYAISSELMAVVEILAANP